MMELKLAFDKFLSASARRGRLRSHNSIKDYSTTYRLFVDADNTFLDDTTVEAFLMARYPHVATRNKALAHISSFVSWSRKQREDYTPIVGSFSLSKEPTNKALPLLVQDSDAITYLGALKPINEKAWAHQVIQRNTGLRFTEVLNLRYAHYYEPSPGKAFIKFFGKGGRERIVPLNHDAFEAFKFWVKMETFPHEDTVRKAIVLAQHRTGTHFKPHHLRHTVATKLRAKGASYDQIADLLGNSVEVVRSNYSRVDHTMLESLVKGL